jgi:hydrogenase maturation protease
MTDPNCEALVLGIGNVLWADEGFGVRCAEALAARWQVPADVRILDGGTQGLYLLPYVQGARRLIVFDAIDYGLAPGTLRVVEGDEVPRFMAAKKMSLHQTGFQEVISAAELTGKAPEAMVLIGVQPEELEDFGGGLRASVREQIPQALALAVDRLRQWGFDPVPRPQPVPDDSALGLAAYEGGRPSEEAACRVGDERFLRMRDAGR